ncbi:transposase [Streptomyces sp. NPDC087538]|uniref:transposase n=1 Tax=Streptomyces sp. NPDC087538 TaxID=3365797 RepID=UPI003827109F
MTGRDALTDEQWALIDPLTPSSGRGGQWRDHRQVVDGILWQLRTGAPWHDVPERYGPWKTLHERLRRWTADGTWHRVLEHVQTGQEDAAIGSSRSTPAWCAPTSTRPGPAALVGARPGSKTSPCPEKPWGVPGAA